MPSLITTSLPFSPAELSFLHSSLSLQTPIRPDGRSTKQFRPLTAETDVLPAVNGSAHVGFEDGAEALVGVKAEVERTKQTGISGDENANKDDVDMTGAEGAKIYSGGGQEWVSLNLDISGTRDDDPSIAFLSEMLREALVAGNILPDRLVINSRWHWKLYIDVLLLSQLSPTNIPLPLLSLTTHLALLSTRLPRLKSQDEEDPLFDDDWEASTYLYERSSEKKSNNIKPPITLLTAHVGPNVLFDPSREELAVAEGILAVSVGPSARSPGRLNILAVRTLDSAARDTFPGVPRDGGGSEQAQEIAKSEGVWTPPRGGIKRSFLKRVMTEAVDVASEVMADLDGFVG